MKHQGQSGGTKVLQAIEAFFASQEPSFSERPPWIRRPWIRRPWPARDLGVVVAFSGGGDSTALLWGLSQLSTRQPFRLTAAHVDHGLDRESRSRAERAQAIAARLEVDWVSERRPVQSLRKPGEGIEEAARRVRYEYLEKVRRTRGADWIVTAHHLDDQLETVLLRLLLGSGLAGLAGIRERRGRLGRPLLGLPRSLLAKVVDELGLDPVSDPTNWDLQPLRNRLRRWLASEPHDGSLAVRAGSLASRALRARRVIDQRLEGELDLRDEHETWISAAETTLPERPFSTISVDKKRLLDLPPPLRPSALALLHRRAGAHYPPRGSAQRELWRQLETAGRARADAGGAWRWRTHRDRLFLLKEPVIVDDFSYTLLIPGELWIPELSTGIRLVRGEVCPWMYGKQPHRAGLAIDLDCGAALTVRNRRPGDQVWAFGSKSPRQLKGLFDAQGVPQHRHSHLPILCAGPRILWIPGVTQAEATRIPVLDKGPTDPNQPDRRTAEQRKRVWIAELFHRRQSPDESASDSFTT